MSKDQEPIRIPVFCHKEIEWLYCNGLHIGESKIDHLLSLPVDTLIQDLELVLKDSIYRFDPLVDGMDDRTEDETSYVIHSLFLLGELKSNKSISVIIFMLCQSHEFAYHFLGDFQYEIWEVLYKLSPDLETLKYYMSNVGVDTWAHNVVSETIVQLVLHEPKRRADGLKWFDNVISSLNISEDQDALGILISSIIDINGWELIPLVTECYNKEFSTDYLPMSLTEVQSSLQAGIEKTSLKKPILSIIDRYNIITSTWAGYKKE